ncbi:3-hydroxyacyl-ACP dehydratase FabZ [Glaciimonas sp. PCH181]|uniref:3-hydroxyacyl-ACP dehydratase FabZ n=1 Tax=Glaciimonas sp. PCH181 TaxID=2133943 RepID=UPI000D3D4093|nr:3-hydroxyacyl-ACP dehydratase FabZ [Glaciimonas sp. PCH181]PUA19380.1 3-hydroxyacyl-[acyl-carrier-protein] dehydratase FabZ [Glaciimonas sp. PCH181]
MNSLNNGLDISQIKEYLPHRYPLLLVDRVLSWESGKSITAIKNVTINEEFFNGHFPNKPVMPGVLTIEALAQAAALLSFLSDGRKPDENTVVYFLGIDKARFRRPIEPGDQIKLEVEILRVVRGIWKYKAIATVDGELAVEAEFMCTMRHAVTPVHAAVAPTNPSA